MLVLPFRPSLTCTALVGTGFFFLAILHFSHCLALVKGKIGSFYTKKEIIFSLQIFSQCIPETNQLSCFTRADLCCYVSLTLLSAVWLFVTQQIVNLNFITRLFYNIRFSVYSRAIIRVCMVENLPF